MKREDLLSSLFVILPHLEKIHEHGIQINLPSELKCVGYQMLLDYGKDISENKADAYNLCQQAADMLENLGYIEFD